MDKRQIREQVDHIEGRLSEIAAMVHAIESIIGIELDEKDVTARRATNSAYELTLLIERAVKEASSANAEICRQVREDS